jgi:predicted dehydrogenase
MKVLILGLGSIAKKHVAALQSISDSFQIHALRSSKSANNYQSVIDLYSIEEAQTNTYDFAIVSNPTSEHEKGIELLKVLNCPLFIEKPLFHNLSIEKTVNDITRQGLYTYVACNLRFLDSLNYIKRFVVESDKKINEVNAYCGSYLPEWRKGTDFRKAYSTIPELGGGVHIDLIHEIDYLYWLFGSPSDVHRVFTHKSTLEIEAYDYANYCLEYPSFCASVILNYYRRDAKRCLEVVMEDETIEVDLLRNEVKSPDGKILFKSDQTILDTYKAQMEYFINQISTGKRDSFNTIMDAYHVLQICLEK